MLKGHIYQLAFVHTINLRIPTHIHELNTHIHSTSGFIRMLQMNEQGLKKHTCLYFISRTIQSTKHPHTACIFVVVLSVSFYSCYNCSTSNIVCNKNSK